MFSDFNASLRDRISKNASIYGNKSANLMELNQLCLKLQSKRIHIQIPAIYPISDLQVKKHLNKYSKEWLSLWNIFVKEHQTKNITSSNETLQILRTLIFDTFKDHPLDISDLGLREDETYMVRSSGFEDTEEVQNPGGNQSVAGVKPTEKDLSAAIGEVVASYFSEKSLAQRKLAKDDITQKSFMPVLLQTMISENHDHGIVSGVIYADSNHAHIQAAYGHGELIVNSKGPFDTFDVTRDNQLHAEVHQKPARLALADSKGDSSLTWVENSKSLQNIPVFPSMIAKEIGAVGKEIAKHYGEKMDIEFVYKLENKTLYLVQARPLPKQMKKTNPSAFTLNFFKKIPEDAKQPIQIITAGNHGLKIIINPSEIIVKKNIEKALHHFLNLSEESQSKIMAVLIEEPAPNTSHEAAQFNALSIPVVQSESIPSWLNGTLAFAIDMQHQHMVNLSFVEYKSTEDLKKELSDPAITQEGLLLAPLTKKSLIPDYSALDPIIKKYLPQNSIQHIDISYKDLLNDMTELESALFHNRNKKAFHALHHIALFFAKWGTSKPPSKEKTRLFLSAFRSIAEIDHALRRYSLLKTSDKKEHQALLETISPLKALIISPETSHLYSGSIFQWASREKELKSFKHLAVSHTKQDYLMEFLKLSKLCYTDEGKKWWGKFVTLCTLNTSLLPNLCQFILKSHQYHLMSEMINIYFIKYTELARDLHVKKPHKYILEKLCQEIHIVDQELNESFLEKHRQIASFESRIPDWSNVNKFEKLYHDLVTVLIPLEKTFNTSEMKSNIAKKAVLNEMRYLVNVFDQSIKSLKGSTEYQGQITLLLNRFYSLIDIYADWMKKWVNQIPDEYFMQWSSANSDENSKENVLKQISNRLNVFGMFRSESDLHPSNGFSVAASRIGSTASFKRHFSNMTLEDLFTVIHQNLEATLSILSKEKSAEVFLPPVLQKIIQIMIPDKKDSLNFTKTDYDYPNITLEFNIPLQNHGAKILFKYGTNKKSCMFHVQFFAPDHNARVQMIQMIVRIENIFTNAKVIIAPHYNESSYLYEHAIEFNGDQITPFLQHLKTTLNLYFFILNKDNPDPIQSYKDVFSRYLKTKIKLNSQQKIALMEILNGIQTINMLRIFTIQHFIELFDSDEISPKILNIIFNMASVHDLMDLMKWIKPENIQKHDEAFLKILKYTTSHNLSDFIESKHAEDYINTCPENHFLLIKKKLHDPYAGFIILKLLIKDNLILTKFFTLDELKKYMDISLCIEHFDIFDYKTLEVFIDKFGLQNHIHDVHNTTNLFEKVLKNFNQDGITHFMDKYIPNIQLRLRTMYDCFQSADYEHKIYVVKYIVKYPQFIQKKSIETIKLFIKNLREIDQYQLSSECSIYFKKLYSQKELTTLFNASFISEIVRRVSFVDIEAWMQNLNLTLDTHNYSENRILFVTILKYYSFEDAFLFIYRHFPNFDDQFCNFFDILCSKYLFDKESYLYHSNYALFAEYLNKPENISKMGSRAMSYIKNRIDFDDVEENILKFCPHLMQHLYKNEDMYFNHDKGRKRTSPCTFFFKQAYDTLSSVPNTLNTILKR